MPVEFEGGSIEPITSSTSAKREVIGDSPPLLTRRKRALLRSGAAFVTILTSLGLPYITTAPDTSCRAPFSRLAEPKSGDIFSTARNEKSQFHDAIRCIGIESTRMVLDGLDDSASKSQYLTTDTIANGNKIIHGHYDFPIGNISPNPKIPDYFISFSPSQDEIYMSASLKQGKGPSVSEDSMEVLLSLSPYNLFGEKKGQLTTDDFRHALTQQTTQVEAILFKKTAGIASKNTEQVGIYFPSQGEDAIIFHGSVLDFLAAPIGKNNAPVTYARLETSAQIRTAADQLQTISNNVRQNLRPAA